MPEPIVPGVLLLGLDLQAPFVSVIAERDTFVNRVKLALAAAHATGLPAALTEQVPAKLGPTIDDVLSAAGPDCSVFPKSTFSALADEAVSNHVSAQQFEHLILCGLETPICVYQTAIDALNQDLQVTVLSDAVGARRPADATVVLAALARLGVHVLPTETVFYALLHNTGHPAFKTFTALVKSHG